MPCAACGTRVFTYATVANDEGIPLAHYCTMCANRINGVPLCAICQRPIESDDTHWWHRDRYAFNIRHDAKPEL
jgi:hypothetical protein